MSNGNDDTNGDDGAELSATAGSASLSVRQKEEPKYELPRWGNSITAGELITILLQREGTRDDALETLAQTLASLGISGEEIAHWQKKPGICHDCGQTDTRVMAEWDDKAATFPQEPIEMYRGYVKADLQNDEMRDRHPSNSADNKKDNRMRTKKRSGDAGSNGGDGAALPAVICSEKGGPEVWNVVAWGDVRECRSVETVMDEVREAVELGCRTVSIERQGSPNE